MKYQNSIVWIINDYLPSFLFTGSIPEALYKCSSMFDIGKIYVVVEVGGKFAFKRVHYKFSKRAKVAICILSELFLQIE